MAGQSLAIIAFWKRLAPGASEEVLIHSRSKSLRQEVPGGGSRDFVSTRAESRSERQSDARERLAKCAVAREQAQSKARAANPIHLRYLYDEPF